MEPHATIAEIKNLFTKNHPQWYPARQSLRLDPSEYRPPLAIPGHPSGSGEGLGSP